MIRYFFPRSMSNPNLSAAANTRSRVWDVTVACSFIRRETVAGLTLAARATSATRTRGDLRFTLLGTLKQRIAKIFHEDSAKPSPPRLNWAENCESKVFEELTRTPAMQARTRVAPSAKQV